MENFETKFEACFQGICQRLQQDLDETKSEQVDPSNPVGSPLHYEKLASALVALARVGDSTDQAIDAVGKVLPFIEKAGLMRLEKAKL